MTLSPITPPSTPSACPAGGTSWSKSGAESLLKATQETDLKPQAIRTSDLSRMNVNPTVQPKAIRYPTDAHLNDRAREHLVKAALCTCASHERGTGCSAQAENQVGCAVFFGGGRPIEGDFSGGRALSIAQRALFQHRLAYLYWTRKRAMGERASGRSMKNARVIHTCA